MSDANWLVCWVCGSPIVAADELIAEPSEAVLREAVYTYPLELMGREVAVYSATNPGATRFDIVRACFSSTTVVPELARKPQVGSGADRASIRNFLRQLQGRSLDTVRVGVAQGGSSNVNFVDEEATASMIEELERYAAQDDSEEENPEEDEEEEDTGQRVKFRGVLSAEFSWFPSFKWNMLSCAVCNDHLGWAFYDSQTSLPAFLGLIVTKLREKHFP